jgi:hypothetical protein
MNGPVVLFVLLSISPNVDAEAGTQTVGYYATTAECQMDLIKLSKTIDRSKTKLDCRPLRISE